MAYAPFAAQTIMEIALADSGVGAEATAFGDGTAVEMFLRYSGANPGCRVGVVFNSTLGRVNHFAWDLRRKWGVPY